MMPVKILKISRRLQLGRLVTPLPDRQRPIYRWFQIKESFSSGLVRLLAETWGLGKNELVLDPFCGAGTTPLACRELGIDCMGFEAHPVFLFASRVKLNEYKVEDLRQSVERISQEKFESADSEFPPFIKCLVPKNILADVLSIKQKILEIKEEKARDFMMLGLAASVFESGIVHRDGAVLKPGKGRIANVRNVFRRRLLEMCADVEQFKGKPCDVRVERGDARKIEMSDDSVDAVITSPPYLQKQEYSRAYSVEQWLLGLEGPKPEELIGGRGGPDEGTEIYFQDMRVVLEELSRVCRPGARVCLVVSDGCSPAGVVEACLRLSEMAREAGFKPKQVVVVNERWCTTPSRRKLGIARESLLVWEKPS